MAAVATCSSPDETGRSHYWSDDANIPLMDGWWFWRQAESCAYEIPPDGIWDRHLKWFIPATHKSDTPAGPQPTHYDRPISAALVAVYNELIAQGLVITSQNAVTIIKPQVPLDPRYLRHSF